MFNFHKVFTNSPDIHDQTNQTSQADNNIIRSIIKSFQIDYDSFKNEESNNQVEKKSSFKNIIEYQKYKRTIYQVIKQSN